MRNLILLAFSVITLSGCGLARMNDTADEMQESRRAYNECILQNAKNLHACDAQKLVYENNLKAYNNMASQFRPGYNSTNTFNVNSTSGSSPQ